MFQMSSGRLVGTERNEGHWTLFTRGAKSTGAHVPEVNPKRAVPTR